MTHTSPIAAALGFAAALSMSNPASAADMQPQAAISAMPQGFSTSAHDAGSDISEWRRCGWRGCYRRGWHGHGSGVSAGDVLAGAVIIGGIAAIASAASNNNRRRDRDVVVVERPVRYDDRRYDDRRYDDRRNPRISGGTSGIDSAVSQCLGEIERDVRVDRVDNATRIAQGWIVTGTVFDGSGFTCEIGNDGRIADITFGSFRGSDASGSAPGQWSDDRYADARASLSNSRFVDIEDGRPAEPLVPLTAERLPAYPGGPVPGE